MDGSLYRSASSSPVRDGLGPHHVEINDTYLFVHLMTLTLDRFDGLNLLTLPA